MGQELGPGARAAPLTGEEGLGHPALVEVVGDVAVGKDVDEQLPVRLRPWRGSA